MQQAVNHHLGPNKTSTFLMEILSRVFIASLFLMAGTRKLMDWGTTLSYFAKLGLPAPEILLPLIVALEIVGAVLLVIGWRLPVVAIALAAFTVSAALAAHAFWRADPTQFGGQINNFFKNVAIVGGLVHVASASLARRRTQDSTTRP